MFESVQLCAKQHHPICFLEEQAKSFNLNVAVQIPTAPLARQDVGGSEIAEQVEEVASSVVKGLGGQLSTRSPGIKPELTV